MKIVKLKIMLSLLLISQLAVADSLSAITPIQYGADPTGRIYSDGAFHKFFDDAKIKGRGYIPAGKYVFSQPLDFDLGSVAEKGITLEGDGINNTILDVSQVKTSPQVFIGSYESKPVFYSKFTNFGIAGNSPDTVLMLGKRDLKDQLNEFIISLNVTNSNLSNSPQANAVELNANFNGSYRFIANINGLGKGGDVLRCRQCQFSTFSGSYGNGTTALHLTDSYSFGNVFLAPDFERTNYGLVIDSKNAVNNVFLGGQWENTTHAVNTTAGNNNILLSPNFTYPNALGNTIGIAVLSNQENSNLKFSITIKDIPSH